MIVKLPVKHHVYIINYLWPPWDTIPSYMTSFQSSPVRICTKSNEYKMYSLYTVSKLRSVNLLFSGMYVYNVRIFFLWRWPLILYFLKDVWIRIQRASVASRRATILATHLPDIATHMAWIKSLRYVSNKFTLKLKIRALLLTMRKIRLSTYFWFVTPPPPRLWC
jgi:hypothetical protein